MLLFVYIQENRMTSERRGNTVWFHISIPVRAQCIRIFAKTLNQQNLLAKGVFQFFGCEVNKGIIRDFSVLVLQCFTRNYLKIIYIYISSWATATVRLAKRTTPTETRHRWRSFANWQVAVAGVFPGWRWRRWFSAFLWRNAHKSWRRYDGCTLCVHVSTVETLKDIERLSAVTTNLGRGTNIVISKSFFIEESWWINERVLGRAWLYFALNDQLLESYLNCYVLNQPRVSKFYLSDALVLDPDQLQVVITLCMGLEHFKFDLTVVIFILISLVKSIKTIFL